MRATDAPFDLVEVKLAPPSTRPGTVAKTDVIAELGSSRAPLVSVVAPAGYGKTTFLSRWAEADPRAFAWVALDARDDDPVVLLRYVAGAMHRLEPLSPDVFAALSGPGGSGWAKRVVRLANAMAAREQPFVLAFDDLHVVNNPACFDVIAELLESVPTGSQIAVASREEPALPLGPLARPRVGARARPAGAPAGRRRGGAAPAGGRSRVGRGRGQRADRAHGGLAGRSVPGCALDPSRLSELGERRGLHRRRPVRGRLLSQRADLAAAGR